MYYSKNPEIYPGICFLMERDALNAPHALGAPKPMRDALKDDVYLKEIPKLKDRIKKLEENNK